MAWRKMIRRREKPSASPGEHELLLSQDEHLRPGQPRVQRPADRQDGDVDALHARADDGEDRDHENEERERDDDVDEPHDHRVDPAAEVASDGAEDHAVDERRVGQDESELEIDPRRVDDPGEDVPSEVVRPHDVIRRRRLEGVDEVLGVGRVRSDQRREDRGQSDEPEDPGADVEGRIGPAPLCNGAAPEPRGRSEDDFLPGGHQPYRTRGSTAA